MSVFHGVLSSAEFFASTNFRSIQGYQDLPNLIEALRTHVLDIHKQSR